MEENKNIEKEVAPKKTATKKPTAKKKAEPKDDSSRPIRTTNGYDV